MYHPEDTPVAKKVSQGILTLPLYADLDLSLIHIYTAAQVERVKDFACLDAVIVVDNNSSDGSGKRLEKLEDSKISVPVSYTHLCSSRRTNYWRRFPYMYIWSVRGVFYRDRLH